jgi:hypothetical protein
MQYAKIHTNYGLQRLAQSKTIAVTENKIDIVAI